MGRLKVKTEEYAELISIAVQAKFFAEFYLKNQLNSNQFTNTLATELADRVTKQNL